MLFSYHKTLINVREAALLLSRIAPFVHLFSAAVASFEKLRETIDRQPLIDGASPSSLALSDTKGGFELKCVSFFYPSRPETTVLDYVNIAIPAFKQLQSSGSLGYRRLARIY